MSYVNSLWFLNRFAILPDKRCRMKGEGSKIAAHIRTMWVCCNPQENTWKRCVFLMSCNSSVARERNGNCTNGATRILIPCS